MAKAGKNVLTRGLSGKLGNQVVFRNTGEATIISTAPGNESGRRRKHSNRICSSSKRP